MNKSDIIEKIKKLLEINRANGATEAEEMAALARVNALMTKYQIEKHLLNSSAKSKNLKKEVFITDISRAFSDFRCSVADFFGVLALENTVKYSFYGAEEYVNLACDMTIRANTALALNFTDYVCSDKYRQNRQTISRSAIRTSFHDGFYYRLSERLEELIKERERDTLKATGTNLVVLNDENLKNSYNDDFGIKLETAKAKRIRTVDVAAYRAGTAKAEEFRILQEVDREENEKVNIQKN